MIVNKFCSVGGGILYGILIIVNLFWIEMNFFNFRNIGMKFVLLWEWVFDLSKFE